MFSMPKISTILQTIAGLSFFFLFSPFFATASELRLEANDNEIKTGDEFVITVVLHASEPINAVAGKLTFAPEMLSVKETSDGNSSVDFWIEKPYLVADNALMFSGITPGGFSGVSNRLFSVVFQAKQNGSASITLADAQVLRNDGTGAPAQIAIFNTAITVTNGNSEISQETLEDSTPPESFTPTVAHDSSLPDDAWFVAFATKDKDAGMSHYEIKEYNPGLFSFLSTWKIAKSPYFLTDQELRSAIAVRAVDAAGNTQAVELAPLYPASWYADVSYWAVIGVLLLLLCVVAKKLNRRGE